MGSPPVEPDSSNASPSRMVRAVMATSRPRRPERWPTPCRCRGSRRSRARCDDRRTREVRVPSTARRARSRVPGRPDGRTARVSSGRAFSRRLAARSLRRSRSLVPAQYPTRSGTAERVPQALGADRAPRTQLLGACRGTAAVGDEHLDTFAPTCAQGLPPRAAQQLHDHRRDAFDIGLARGADTRTPRTLRGWSCPDFRHS